MDKEEKDLIIFGSVFSVVWGLLFARSFLKHGFTLFGGLFLCVAVIMLALTIFRRDLLAMVKVTLAKVARPIGNLLTMLMMAAVFYLVVTPTGLVMRLMGKDILDEKIEPGRASYWNTREKKPWDKQQYFRQF